MIFDSFRSYTKLEAFESVRSCLPQRLGVPWGLRERSSCAQTVQTSTFREEACALFLALGCRTQSLSVGRNHQKCTFLGLSQYFCATARKESSQNCQYGVKFTSQKGAFNCASNYAVPTQCTKTRDPNRRSASPHEVRCPRSE